MIYSEKLNASFTNSASFNLPGCRNIMFMAAKNLTGYAMKNRQVNTISTISGDRKFSKFDNLENLRFSCIPQSGKNGTYYDIEVTFTITGLKTDTTYILDALQNTEVTAIVEDENTRFWLLGFGNGLRTNYEANSDESAYMVKMTTKQLTNIVEVSYELMNTIQFNPGELTATPDPVYLQPVSSNPGGSGSAGNVFNTVTLTTNNYQVQNQDHFLKSSSARTVLLPETPLEGQMHIFKVSYDASVVPFIIQSASHYIDGNSQIEINTSYGAIEVVFSGNAWYATAFVA